MKNKIHLDKKIPWEIVGFLLIILLTLLLLWKNDRQNNQSVSAMYPTVVFRGEYQIGDNEWKEIVEGEHIPSTKGDVTLRGTFHIISPMDEYVGPLEANIPVSFYTDHINLTIYENGMEPYVMDNENPMFGTAACGENWTGYSLSQDSMEPIEIVIHNPHFFGNENAVDKFLENMALWVNLDFERDVMNEGNLQRTAGFMFVIVAFILLGMALYSELLHLTNNKMIWLLGLAIFFSGGYFVYSAEGVSFWSASISTNTTLLGVCMMLYMLCISCVTTYTLSKTKRVSMIANGALGVANGILILIPIVTKIPFYDTLFAWVVVQNVVSMVLLGCLLFEALTKDNTSNWIRGGIAVALLGFELDVIANSLTYWDGGLISKYVFIILFANTLFMVLKIFPNSVKESMRAKELEAEKKVLNAALTESRVSTMISQIRPHFIYNALGNIEQLCEINPAKAAELVHNFSKYLRGNFGELDNPKPIRMSQEMEHVKHYISIENVRFPDMVFTFEMNSVDFKLPALTIQPIIENAIKHGLMKLEKGGSIHVTSFETDTHYCVSVVDDGVGFDTSILIDERKHIGIRNIRGRLEAMVKGTLEIESTVGVGTKVMIKIPKGEVE